MNSTFNVPEIIQGNLEELRKNFVSLRTRVDTCNQTATLYLRLF